MRFGGNMNLVDRSMIEAEKTGERAREYSYWTKMAGSYKGRIQADALKNRVRVFSEYQDQAAASSRKMQSEIGRRMAGKKSDRQILEQARTRNEMAMREAELLWDLAGTRFCF